MTNTTSTPPSGTESVHIHQYLPKETFERLFDVSTDNRKFEIELLWKRTVIFWGFISALFVVVYRVNVHYKFEVSLIGLVFSVIWTLVNKGSKAWQQSWEKKTEYYARKLFHGYEHLYKKVHEDDMIKRRQKLKDSKWKWFKLVMFSIWDFITPNPLDYSMSKLLISISNFYVLLWIAALIHYCSLPYLWFFNERVLHIAFFVVCLLYLVLVFILARSNKKNNADELFQLSND